MLLIICTDFLLAAATPCGPLLARRGAHNLGKPVAVIAAWSTHLLGSIDWLGMLMQETQN